MRGSWTPGAWAYPGRGVAQDPLCSTEGLPNSGLAAASQDCPQCQDAGAASVPTAVSWGSVELPPVVPPHPSWLPPFHSPSGCPFFPRCWTLRALVSGLFSCYTLRSGAAPWFQTAPPASTSTPLPEVGLASPGTLSSARGGWAPLASVAERQQLERAVGHFIPLHPGSPVAVVIPSSTRTP